MQFKTTAVFFILFFDTVIVVFIQLCFTLRSVSGHTANLLDTERCFYIMPPYACNKETLLNIM